MTGFQVHRKAGWDTHGLPVEIEVEKSSGFKHKEDIVRYGVAEFNAKCRESVWKYKTEWERMTEQMGYWVDLSRPYVTFENDYIESVWWALKRFFDEGLIYKGYKIQPYCPRCETPLSSHEVSLGYEDVKDPSVYVRIRAEGVRRHVVPGLDDHPVDADLERRAGGGARRRLREGRHQGEKLILAEARLSVLGRRYPRSWNATKGRTLPGRNTSGSSATIRSSGKAFYVVEANS